MLFGIQAVLDRDFDVVAFRQDGRKEPLPVLGDGVDNDDPYRALPLERWRDRYVNAD